jgi:hypothetical protein
VHCDYIICPSHNGLVQGCNTYENDSLDIDNSTHPSGEVHQCDMVLHGDNYSCASDSVQNPILSNQYIKCNFHECYKFCCDDHSQVYEGGRLVVPGACGCASVLNPAP